VKKPITEQRDIKLPAAAVECQHRLIANSLIAKTRIVRFSLAMVCLAILPSLLRAQTAATSPEVQALQEEVRQLKERHVGVESRLSALSPSKAPETLRATSTNLLPVVAALASTRPVPIGEGSSAPAPASEQAGSEPPHLAEQTSSEPAPFAFGDFTWMNGQSRQKSQPLTNSFATVNLYVDTYYGYSFNHPKDDTIVGSGAVGRNTEWQINNATIGIDTNYKNVLGKITLQSGNQLAVTQDLDGTVNRGRNLSVANNKYIGEAVAGYHFDKLDGINVGAGYL
jgi:hypothetical protein